MAMAVIPRPRCRSSTTTVPASNCGVRQLLTGRHFTQSPRSPLRRVVSNIELLEDDGSVVHVTSNAIVFEAHVRGDTVWASRTEYRLRRENGSFRIVLKKVVLANNDRPLFSMAFLM